MWPFVAAVVVAAAAVVVAARAQYLSEASTLPEDADVLDFWVQHKQVYPDMADVAFDILTIPASSAPIKRVFSTAGNVSAGKRNRLSGAKLEREVLIKNKSFLSLLEMYCKFLTRFGEILVNILARIM